MVDFKKLRKDHGASKPVDPIELFHRLPGKNINDLWNSQAEALKKWHEKRDEKDAIIKLNTGGGKTLVGLIIAQSITNETNRPTLYLCPTTQLTEQTFDLSREYGFKTTIYRKGSPLDEDFTNGKSIMIATYAALFNAKSKFGVKGRSGGHVPLEGIILDDAHTAFSNIRDYFTLSIKSITDEDLYNELCSIFRSDFDEMGQIGTFDDLVSKRDPRMTTILEVPYWSWKRNLDVVRDLIAKNAITQFPFVWPLLRDEFKHCHALIESKSFSITPLYPLVDYFPSFSECSRRIYMSATLEDDSSVIRTFDADMRSVSKPIVPSNLTSVGERMILVPSLMNIDHEDIREFVKKIALEISETAGVLILVPSNRDLRKWNDIATTAERSEDVNMYIRDLRSGASTNKIYAFSSRYDGLDLPNDSCRLIIMDGEPVGENTYDLFRREVLENSRLVNTFLAQRIEQGIGRGTRSSGDYCVIIILGINLVSWITKVSNLEQLTPITQSQLELGNEISRHVSTLEEFKDTIYKCIKRDKDWIEYHAEIFAKTAMSPTLDLDSLEIAAAERKYFDFIRRNEYNNAIGVLDRCIREKEIDAQLKGWLIQLSARASYFMGNEELSGEYQRDAYHINRSLLMPQAESQYIPILNPGEQSKAIVEPIINYRQRKGYLSKFDKVASDLTPGASSNQFEESLKLFGEILGFSSQRPEKEFKIGPDILWITGNVGFVIEAKSKKNIKSPLRKDEFGQLSASFDWFKNSYDGYEGIKVVVHPNNYFSRSISPNRTIYALTMSKLSMMISNVNKLLKELCNSTESQDVLTVRCEKRIEELNLTAEKIIDYYLTPFQAEPENK